MRRLLLLGAALSPAPAVAQSMDHRHMPGMAMPARPAAKPARTPQPRPKRATPAPAKRTPKPAPAPDPHAGHAMSAMPGMAMPASEPATTDPHAGHDMAAMEGMAPTADAVGTDLPPGNKPAPAPARDHLADRFWGAQAMAAARDDVLRREHGGMTFAMALLDLAEVDLRRGRDGYRWEGQAWVGGDLHRLWLKSEGEGSFGRAVGSAEVQALYSRALDPYWNLQAGIRHDLRPGPARTYATLGVEGLAPGWFEVGGALFLSTKGELLGRVEGYYDQRITNDVVLQPRVEANLAAQDVRATGTGAGLSTMEAGLRLRYEGRREFAPYIGVAWERRFGQTARFGRARGGDTGGASVVLGVRAWF